MSAGVDFDKYLVVQGDFDQPSGFAAAQHLLSLSRPPSAIFAANDLMAFGVLEAAREQGLRTPSQLSVIGFDDIPLASQVYPPLTTIRQPLYEMGAAAARMLIGIVRGVEPPASRITLQTELVERATTVALSTNGKSKVLSKGVIGRINSSRSRHTGT
jgi:LacI family transcriptional regulator